MRGAEDTQLAHAGSMLAGYGDLTLLPRGWGFVRPVVDRASVLAAAVRAQHDELRDVLTRVETRATADTELGWLVSGLESTPEWLARRRGVGTVFVATPATLPMYSFLLFALAPLMAGNRVVCRPASASRGCVEVLAGIAADADLAVEITDKPWAEFARDAAEQSNGVVFCGSADHARQLCEQLPPRVRVVCQGPGVCAMVVTASADIPAAAEAAVRTRVFNNGQDCLATERVYIADDVYEEFTDAALAAAEMVRTGGNDDPATDIGPLLIPSAADQWHPRLGEHGRLLHGGARPHGDVVDLVVLEAAADSSVVLEETYWPVLPLVRYRSDRELRDMLSMGDFALGLTVFGHLPRFGTLDFGHVAVNDTLYAAEDAWSPFGGNRSTTLLRERGVDRRGPVLVPWALSEPA